MQVLRVTKGTALKDTEVQARTWQRPSVRDIDDLWCWMNTWGNWDKHGYDWRAPESIGYRQCITDLMYALAEAGVDDVPDEAWARWTSRG